MIYYARVQDCLQTKLWDVQAEILALLEANEDFKKCLVMDSYSKSKIGNGSLKLFSLFVIVNTID
jgi:hypothetical protein